MHAVSNEAVAEYLPSVYKAAHIFNKMGGAEYDDLVQEGALHVFLKIRDGQPVTSTGIKNAQLDWVRKCRRRGFTDDPAED